MKALLRKNKYLSSINRLRHGQKPVFIEYDIDFTPRWTGDKTGNPHLAKIISKNKKTFQSNLKRLSTYEDVVQDIQKGKFKNYDSSILNIDDTETDTGPVKGKTIEADRTPATSVVQSK